MSNPVQTEITQRVDDVSSVNCVFHSSARAARSRRGATITPFPASLPPAAAVPQMKYPGTPINEQRVDPGCTPGGIRAMHLDDEIANLWLNARSSKAPQSALPARVEAEALSVPADHGLWAHEEESLTPSRPKLRKPGPEHPVRGLKVDPPTGALH